MAPLSFEAKVEMKALERTLKAAAPEVFKELRNELRTTGQTVKSIAQAEAPRFTGNLRGAIVSRLGRGLFVTIRARAPHSWIIGKGGRKPGKMPPPRELEEWARQKFGNPRLAFVIARAIQRKGIRPNKFLDRAWAQEQPAFLPRMAQALERAIARVKSLT